MKNKQNLVAMLGLAGALVLTGCSSKDRIETTTRTCSGDYKGFSVTINDKREVIYSGNTIAPKFSMTVQLFETKDSDSRFDMIYGKDDSLDGEWDYVTHLGKGKRGYYDLYPNDIIYAKRMLDEATEAVGIPENCADFEKSE